MRRYLVLLHKQRTYHCLCYILSLSLSLSLSLALSLTDSVSVSRDARHCDLAMHAYRYSYAVSRAQKPSHHAREPSRTKQRAQALAFLLRRLSCASLASAKVPSSLRRLEPGRGSKGEDYMPRPVKPKPLLKTVLLLRK